MITDPQTNKPTSTYANSQTGLITGELKFKFKQGSFVEAEAEVKAERSRQRRGKAEAESSKLRRGRLNSRQSRGEATP